MTSDSNHPRDERSLAEQAYDAIERLIVTLELPPGHMFSETDLSERIQIGRTPMREALKQLAVERLVVSLPRRGIMVSEVNASEYLALLDTRRVLDRLIAGRAARLATPDQRSALEAMIERLHSASSNQHVDEFLRLDRLCDHILDSAARNPYATRAVSPLHAHCRRFWNLHKHAGDLSLSADLHSRMLGAVIRGDEDAAGDESDALIHYLERFTREALLLT